MKFRKKISFSILVLVILLVPLTRSFPQTFSRNSYIKNKKLPLILSADIFPAAESNDDIWNNAPEYKPFNFPENKYPSISKPTTNLLECKNRTPFQTKSRSKYLAKYDNLRRLKTDSVKIESRLPSEFSSDPNYRDLTNFPQVEYPLKASETWKPNYWNSHTDFSYRNTNVNNYCIKPTLGEYFKPVTSCGKKIEPRSKTKLAGTLKKSPISLKKEKNFTNATVNGFQDENSTVSSNNSMSLSATSSDSKLQNEWTDDVCPINSTSFDEPTVKSIECDIVSNLTTQSQLLVSEYATKFKDEMKSILKSVADNIILNNFEFTKENVMSRAQVMKQIDTLKTNLRNCDSNIHNELASPELLKNRNYKSFNDLTNNDKDFFLSDINLSQKLSSIDNLITTKTEKFKDDMTSFVQSKAENYLNNAIERANDILERNFNYENLIKEIDCPTESKSTQINEDWQKTQFSMPDVMVTEQIDTLHNDIFLKPHEGSHGQATGQQSYTGNDEKCYYNPNLKSTDDLMCFNLDKINHKLPDLKPISQNAVNIFIYDTKTCDLCKTKLENDYPKSNCQTIQKEPNLTDKYVLTESLILPEIITYSNDNDMRNTNLPEFNKSITCENLLPNNNKTSDNEASLTCVSDGNIIYNDDREDEIIISTNDKEENIVCSDSVDKEIEIDEDFTTDSYPENEENDWYSYGLSTVAPRTSTVDTLWRDTDVIESDKCKSFPDELEEYFLMN